MIVLDTKQLPTIHNEELYQNEVTRMPARMFCALGMLPAMQCMAQIKWQRRKRKLRERPPLGNSGYVYANTFLR